MPSRTSRRRTRRSTNTTRRQGIQRADRESQGQLSSAHAPPAARMNDVAPRNAVVSGARPMRRPTSSRAGARRGLRPPLRAVPRMRARGQAPFRGGQLACDRARRARPHRLLRSARRRDGRAHRARLRLRPTRQRRRRRVLGAGQARFIALLVDHRQPECAETFFNTVSSKLLHRTYFHNRCLFVRPAVVDRISRRRRAVVPLLLPAPPGPARRADRPRARPRARRRASTISAPTCIHVLRGDAAAPAAAVRHRREFPDPGAVEPALPQSDRVRRRPRRQRRAHVSVRRGDQARAATSGCTSTRC